ncbi:MAG: hypothetical protein WCW66_01360 [Patescibacteria group bacterium]
MKKIFYIACFTILGIILSFILHAIVEFSYISTKSAEKVFWYNSFGNNSCALPPWIQYGLLLFGILSGLFMGFWGWKVVYIQKRHWKNKS